MARAPRTILRTSPPNFQPTPDDISSPQMGFNLSGMDIESMLNEMEPGFCRLVRNLIIRRNAYEVRPGTSTIGSASSTEVIAVEDVPLSTGINKLVRWRTDGVDVWDGATWQPVGGDAWSGGNSAPFAFTGWGDTVLFTAGIGKIFELSFGPNLLTELTDSPTGVIHLTTFNSRVIATTLTQISWTVAKDSTDWSGLGSGFEDLKSAPEGVSDIPTAVVPVTDEIAAHIRSKSVWQMSVTGNFDAPFSFSKLPLKAGSLYPMTCKNVGSAVMCVGEQGAVWIINTQSASDVASRVRSYITDNESRGAGYSFSAVYDSRFNEYTLIASLNGVQKIITFNIEAQAWIERQYDFFVQHIAFTDFQSLPTTGSIQFRSGYLFATGSARYVVREDPAKDNVALRDVNTLGAAVPTTFRLETGHIKKTDDSLIKDFYELVLWYQALHTAILKFFYSDDEGNTWNLWLDMSVSSNNKVTPLSLTVPTISRDAIMLAISCNSVETFRMNKLEVWMRESGRRVDAS